MQDSDRGPMPVLNGIDVLEMDEFRAIGDKRVGLIVDQTSRTIEGRRTADVFARAEELFLDRIFAFSPGAEFGAPQTAAAALASSEDVAQIGIGPHAPIAAEQLEGLDALVIDLQDAGSRLSPHAGLLVDALNACAEAFVRVYVLDRPNPLDGMTVEGPSCERSDEAVFARYGLPLRHGMTLGEIARLIKEGDDIGAHLEVVSMLGWQRQYFFEHTEQTWIPPLPGLANLEAAALYAGMGLLADTNVTLRADGALTFDRVSAPWIDGAGLAKVISGRYQEGVSVEALSNGVQFRSGALQSLSPPYLVLAVIESLRELYPGEWDFRKLGPRLARPDLLDAIEDRAAELDQLWAPDPDFFESRARVLLY